MNIIYIITDQQRYDTINALGYPFMETPNIINWLKKAVRLAIVLQQVYPVLLQELQFLIVIIRIRLELLEMRVAGSIPGSNCC